MGSLIKRWPAQDRTFQLEVTNVVIRSGEVLSVQGVNGCGKSTFLELAGLTLCPDKAVDFKLSADNVDIDLNQLWIDAALDDLARLRARHFGYVLQSGSLLPFLSVAQNLSIAQEIAGYHHPDLLSWLSDALSLNSFLKEKPTSLSVGQRQRVAIARALAHAPRFVIADEPTAALDPKSAESVLRLLLDLAAERACALIIVSHDRELLSRLEIPSLPLESGLVGTDWHTHIGFDTP